MGGSTVALLYSIPRICFWFVRGFLSFLSFASYIPGPLASLLLTFFCSLSLPSWSLIRVRDALWTCYQAAVESGPLHFHLGVFTLLLATSP